MASGDARNAAQDGALRPGSRLTRVSTLQPWSRRRAISAGPRRSVEPQAWRPSSMSSLKSRASTSRSARSYSSSSGKPECFAMERAALTRLPSSSTVTGRRAVPRSARPAGLNDVPRYGEAAICLLLVAAGQSQTTCPTTATHERSAPKLNYVTARSERLRARGRPSVRCKYRGVCAPQPRSRRCHNPAAFRGKRHEDLVDDLDEGPQVANRRVAEGVVCLCATVPSQCGCP